MLLSLDDLKLVLRGLAEVTLAASFVFLLPLPFVLFEPSPSFLSFLAYFLPSATLWGLSCAFRRLRVERAMMLRHSVLAAVLAWLLVSLIGSLPYVLLGTLSPLDAIFESVSGWTTTGLTMVKEPEELSYHLLFYRALSQWFGGVGVIALAMFVLLRPGTVAMSYYGLELKRQQLRAGVKGTVKEIWKIYTFYTLGCFLLLLLLGIEAGDALIHSLTVLSTGGFSSHSESVAHYEQSPGALLTIGFFMLVGATSFILHHRLLRGEVEKFWKNVELRLMLVIVAVVSFLSLFEGMGAVFNAISAATGTGFSLAPVNLHSQGFQLLLILLMTIGGCYGATTGGIKVLRLVVLLKTIVYSFKRLVSPRKAMISIKVEGKVLEWEEVVNALALSALYFTTLALSALALSALSELSALEATFMAASALGNVGLVNLEASEWFTMPAPAKVGLIVLMLMGRVEIFPFLALFVPRVRKP